MIGSDQIFVSDIRLIFQERFNLICYRDYVPSRAKGLHFGYPGIWSNLEDEGDLSHHDRFLFYRQVISPIVT